MTNFSPGKLRAKSLRRIKIAPRARIVKIGALLLSQFSLLAALNFQLFGMVTAYEVMELKRNLCLPAYLWGSIIVWRFGGFSQFWVPVCGQSFTFIWRFTVKAGVNVKAVFTSLNTAFLPISRSRFKRRQIPMLITLSTIWQFCVNFWVIFRCFGKERFFSKDRLNWGKYEMLKIWRIWKIEIWSEELVHGYQTVPYQPGALFGGGQLSGSVSNPF